MSFNWYSGANNDCSRLGNVYVTYLQITVLVLWVKVVKEFMAKLKKKDDKFL